MNFPQVAILHWDETKEDQPMYLAMPWFDNLVNGQLALVTGQATDNKNVYRALLYENGKLTYWVDKSNLIFLGEL